jgi:D-alanyl-D-alanine carboxypeptidase
LTRDNGRPPADRRRYRHEIWTRASYLVITHPKAVTIAAKTGTLPAVRNECGVVTCPDGRQYAVAVFTRARAVTERQPKVDASIGTAARLAVDHLRTLSG